MVAKLKCIEFDSAADADGYGFVESFGTLSTKLHSAAGDNPTYACAARFLIGRSRKSLISRLSGRSGVASTRVLWTIVTLSLFAFGFLLKDIVGYPAASIPLDVDPNELNFGTVWLQSDFRWTFKVHNPSRNVVRVTDIRASCAKCTSVNPKTFTLSPNDKREVEVRIDLSKLPLGVDGQSQEDFSVALVPVVDGCDLSNLQPWTLRGNVKTPYQLSSRLINFGEYVVKHSQTHGQRIRISTSKDVQSLDARCTAPFLTVSSRHLDAGGFEIELAPTEDPPLGPFNAHVLLEGLLASGERLPPFPIMVDGEFVADLQAVPPAILLTNGADGKTSEELVSIRSRSGRKLAQVYVDSKSFDRSLFRVDLGPATSSESEHTFVISTKSSIAKYVHSSVRFVARENEQSEEESTSVDVHVIPSEKRPDARHDSVR